jgi:hypothetical protein
MPRKSPLWKFDLENLLKRGLTGETIDDSGFKSDSKGIVIPYHELNGDRNCFHRIRFRSERMIKGKPTRYIQSHPTTSPVRAYFPRACRSKIMDPTLPLFVVEGEFKACILAQHGYAVVGIGGIWNWKKSGSEELIPDLKRIPYENRRVYICFDFDRKSTTQRIVAIARRRLAKALRKHAEGLQ